MYTVQYMLIKLLNALASSDPVLVLGGTLNSRTHQIIVYAAIL